MLKSYELFANLIQTLTSEARVLNPKAGGARVAVPMRGVWAKSPTKQGFRGADPPKHTFFVAEFQYKINKISKTKKLKINFSFDSTHSASII